MWWFCHPLFVNCNIPSSSTDFLCNPSFQSHGHLWVLIMLTRSDDRQHLPACHSKFPWHIVRQISDWDPVNLAIMKFKYTVDNKTTVFGDSIRCSLDTSPPSSGWMSYWFMWQVSVRHDRMCNTTWCSASESGYFRRYLADNIRYHGIHISPRSCNFVYEKNEPIQASRLLLCACRHFHLIGHVYWAGFVNAWFAVLFSLRTDAHLANFNTKGWRLKRLHKVVICNHYCLEGAFGLLLLLLLLCVLIRL